MDILFRNTLTKTEKWAKEIGKFSLFCRPFPVIVHCAALTMFGWGICKILLLRTIDFLLLFIPLYWFFIIALLYIRTNKITIKRHTELYGENAQVISEVSEEGIAQHHANGSKHQVQYDVIKTCYVTQNYILLHSQANMLYTLERGGFSLGSDAEFLEFLRNKGIRIR